MQQLLCSCNSYYVCNSCCTVAIAATDETAAIDATISTTATILAMQFIHNGVSKRFEVLCILQLG
jgi:hypothetical protein